MLSIFLLPSQLKGVLTPVSQNWLCFHPWMPAVAHIFHVFSTSMGSCKPSIWFYIHLESRDHQSRHPPHEFRSTGPVVLGPGVKWWGQWPVAGPSREAFSFRCGVLCCKMGWVGLLDPFLPFFCGEMYSRSGDQAGADFSEFWSYHLGWVGSSWKIVPKSAAHCRHPSGVWPEFTLTSSGTWCLEIPQWGNTEVAWGC